MLFNSFSFLIFFPVVTALYFALPHKYRWALLLIASYFFYMCWRPGYLVLILLSTAVDYACGLAMDGTTTAARRKVCLLLSLAVNLGLLFAFKYLDFAATALRDAAGLAGMHLDIPVFDMMLPVGISFYTFQTLSYTIDVYRGQRPAERRLGIFALYVSFFPQLVAGPIERSTHLLPQFDEEHAFDSARAFDGLLLMLWGLFKKMVIADNLAPFVDSVYIAPGIHPGPSLIIGTVFFAFQIYCDFSGYSDVAIGAARVMGFRLMDNFRWPYHAASIREFWQRWHISLSTWFRDYVYLPLGGNRVSVPRWYLNLLVVFVVSGFWHGANWTFLVWGLLHGIYLVAAIISANFRAKVRRALPLERLPHVDHAVQVGITFVLVCVGWIFFRADNLADAWLILSRLGSDWGRVTTASGFGEWILLDHPGEFLIVLFALGVMELVHAVQTSPRALAVWQASAVLRVAAGYGMILAILLLGNFDEQAFIYFQF